MSNLKNEKAILNDLVKKYGLGHPKLLKQSQKVDKLITEETKRINNIK